MSLSLNGFLADTWWYAMTARLSDEAFRKLVDLRVSQGFSAAQVVVGIPPETTPDDPNAASPFGPAWSWSGEINPAYLKHIRERILAMNKANLTAIVYGAWGHQITWIGTAGMINWWQEVINTTRDLDVRYCLTGESNHNPGWMDYRQVHQQRAWILRLEQSASNNRMMRRLMSLLIQRSTILKKRRHAWSNVLSEVVKRTDIPYIIHPEWYETGFECVENNHLLAANTAQTGHSYRNRPMLHQLPIAHAASNDPLGRGFINLEPWYEGILGRFHGQDQLYAYWVSMLAGTVSFCYGAHGIWNAGDGEFLSKWGKQDFHQALSLDTPRLIGLSHRAFLQYLNRPAQVVVEERDGQLVSIQRIFDESSITFFPEIDKVTSPSPGSIWLPMEGKFTQVMPSSGQVVVFTNWE